MTLAMGMTIANVAVPDIMGAFGVGQDQAQNSDSIAIVFNGGFQRRQSL